MIKLSAAVRKPDSFGDGEYGASRGDRKHNGIDFAPQVHAVSSGTVTKIGYPYGNDLTYFYVQITDNNGNDARYFYVQPCVKVGDKINAGQVIGIMQDLGKRYPGITPHFHFEVKRSGEFLDPHQYLESL